MIPWTFDDGNGNSASMSQGVHVHDTIAPALTDCPTDVTVYTAQRTTCDQFATWTEPAITDNCGTVNTRNWDLPFGRALPRR